MALRSAPVIIVPCRCTRNLGYLPQLEPVFIFIPSYEEVDKLAEALYKVREVFGM